LGGVPKAAILEAFGAQIFFDDQARHCVPAAPRVNTVQVLLPLEPMVTQATENIEVVVKALEVPAGGAPSDRFVLICKRYLGEGFSRQSSKLKAWYVANAAEWDDAAQDKFLDELEVSIASGGAGLNRV